MKLFNYLIDNYINPVIVSTILPIIIASGSKAYTGKWLEWFKLIPLHILWIFSGIFVLWIFLIIIFRRYEHLKNGGGFFSGSLNNARYGYISHGSIEYNKVIWRIRSPKSDIHGNYSRSSIDVEIPPRCPNCETEIEQSNSFWGGYIWKCVMCDFKKRNRESCQMEGGRVKKIARRKLELQVPKRRRV